MIINHPSNLKKKFFGEEGEKRDKSDEQGLVEYRYSCMLSGDCNGSFSF